jgi:hypothetical protein
MNIVKKNIIPLIVGAILLVVLTASASAANTPTLNQTINAGTLTTDILDGSRVPVASPAVAFSAKTFSFDCQFGGSASTGLLGTASQRVYTINPDAADNGWTLTIAATSGATTLWQNGGSTQNYDFNDPTGGNPGCTDGGDTDSRPGQLTIDPSVSTINLDCATCVATNVTKGSSTAFNQGTTDSVTLLNAAAASDDIWRGYLTGVGLSQTIPAEQPADSYSVNMTVTVTAN